MELLIQGRKIEIGPEVQEYISKKVRKLGRRLKNVTTIKVEIAGEETRFPQDRIIAQITLSADGTTLRGQERGPNILAAVDAAVDAMNNRIKGYRGRLYRSEQARKAGQSASIRRPPIESLEMEESDDSSEGQVVRTKRFPMKPMTVEEAIEEMRNLGHSFYLFNNSASEQFNVLYRRRSGGYGLIEPEPL